MDNNFRLGNYWETDGIQVLEVTLSDWYIWMMLNHWVEHITLKPL